MLCCRVSDAVKGVKTDQKKNYAPVFYVILICF